MHVRTNRVGLKAIVVAAFGLAIAPAEAALMTHTMDGGTSTIRGSVGSTNFSNELWTLAATADSSLVQSGCSGLGIPTYFLQTSVTLNIGNVATVTSPSRCFGVDVAASIFALRSDHAGRFDLTSRVTVTKNAIGSATRRNRSIRSASTARPGLPEECIRIETTA